MIIIVIIIVIIVFGLKYRFCLFKNIIMVKRSNFYHHETARYFARGHNWENIFIGLFHVSGQSVENSNKLVRAACVSRN